MSLTRELFLLPAHLFLLAASTACVSDASAPRPCRAIADAVQRVDQERLRRDVMALVSCGTRHPLSPTDDPKRGVGAARAFLRDSLTRTVAASNGRARLREMPFDHVLGRGSEVVGHFVNFVVEIAGRDAARGLYVVGGHYDSRNKDVHDGTRDAPGADDDASGTAVVLELARLLANEPLKATVWLCAFDGEEHGLYGSDALAEEIRQRGLVVEAMATNDIVGASGDATASRRSRLRCFSEGFTAGAEADPFFRLVGAESDGASRQLARYAAQLAAKYVDGLELELVLRRDRFGRGGDHDSFTKRGFPGIRFCEAVEDYRHQHEDVRVEQGVQLGDLPQFVSFPQLARVAQLNLAWVMEGAGAPLPPATVHLEGAVKPDVTVEWSAVADEGVAGYRIWRRATDETSWRDGCFVPRAPDAAPPICTCTLPGCSIDDFQFAVATVGRDGRESPVRFPTAKPKPAQGSATTK